MESGNQRKDDFISKQTRGLTPLFPIPISFPVALKEGFRWEPVSPCRRDWDPSPLPLLLSPALLSSGSHSVLTSVTSAFRPAEGDRGE